MTRVKFNTVKLLSKDSKQELYHNSGVGLSGSPLISRLNQCKLNSHRRKKELKMK